MTASTNNPETIVLHAGHRGRLRLDAGAGPVKGVLGDVARKLVNGFPAVI